MLADSLSKQVECLIYSITENSYRVNDLKSVNEAEGSLHTDRTSHCTSRINRRVTNLKTCSVLQIFIFQEAVLTFALENAY